MSVNMRSGENLAQMHQTALLGIISDFLGWGGMAQADLAKRSLAEVTRRVEQRERAVRQDNKIVAVI